MKIGSFDQSALVEAITHTRGLQTQINGLDKQTSELRDQRDEKLNVIWEGLKRVRSSVKGEYGDDSSQYKLVGGTRMSDRKRSTRKKPE